MHDGHIDSPSPSNLSLLSYFQWFVSYHHRQNSQSAQRVGCPDRLGRLGFQVAREVKQKETCFDLLHHLYNYLSYQSYHWHVLYPKHSHHHRSEDF